VTKQEKKPSGCLHLKDDVHRHGSQGRQADQEARCLAARDHDTAPPEVPPTDDRAAFHRFCRQLKDLEARGHAAANPAMLGPDVYRAVLTDYDERHHYLGAAVLAALWKRFIARRRGVLPPGWLSKWRDLIRDEHRAIASWERGRAKTMKVIAAGEAAREATSARKKREAERVQPKLYQPRAGSWAAERERAEKAQRADTEWLRSIGPKARKVELEKRRAAAFAAYDERRAQLDRLRR
jgi:hypothetical protein